MSDAVEYKRNCGKPGCTVLTTGICIDGQTPVEACRFFTTELADDVEEFDDDFDNEEEITSDLLSDKETESVALSSGEVLTVLDVDEFLRESPLHLVSIIGNNGSGKTTLICSIYSRFFHGSFTDYSFAGSRTLIGLEKRAHYSRVASGLTEQSMERTKYGEGLHFFHFSIRHEKNCHRIELMLSDRAGEEYSDAQNNPKLVSNFIEIHKSNITILLLNGASLISSTKRENELYSVRMYLQIFLDKKALDETSVVYLVTTKMDLINKCPEDEKNKIYDRLDSFRSQIFNLFNNRLKMLSFYDIAANNPENDEFGVDELFKNLIECNMLKLPKKSNRRIHLSSEFDMLLARTPLEVFI